MIEGGFVPDSQQRYNTSAADERMTGNPDEVDGKNEGGILN